MTQNSENKNLGLTLSKVQIQLGDRVLLKVDTHVEPRQVLTIMGPSGSGKSSLLNLIGGFLPNEFSYDGEIKLNGEDILSQPAHQRRIGTLFQDALLFPHMSVGGNLLFAMPKEMPRSDKQEIAENYLEKVSLGGHFERDPATLSGGQRARVALARLLLSEPKALLLDEPFSKCT